MRVIKTADHEEMSEVALAMVLGIMYREGRVNLSITGGTTPVRLYELLAPIVRGRRQFENIHYYNFDEIPYRVTPREGITMSDLRRLFFDPAGVPDERIHPLTVENHAEQDARIAADGGLDAVILGLGFDGHFCGNMPGHTHFGDATVLVPCDERLGDQKLQDRIAGKFADPADVPVDYVTMGPRSIMAARELVMIASGEKKAQAVAKLLSGEVTEAWPSTILTLHPHFTLIADEAALSGVA